MMPFKGVPLDREMEMRHLRLAERHIAEGEQRIVAQTALVERLRAARRPLSRAEDFLELLETTLAGWQHHRRLILAALNE